MVTSRKRGAFCAGLRSSLRHAPTVVSKDERLGWFHAQFLARSLEDDGIGLLGADFGRHHDAVKEGRQAELIQDRTKTRVKVADHRQPEACATDSDARC